MKRSSIMLVIAGAITLGILIGGCRREYRPVEVEVFSTELSDVMPVEVLESLVIDQPKDDRMIQDYVPGELVCLANSEEEAQEIADMYGIELKYYSYGVATLWAGENADLNAIISEGIKKGYPELSLNHVYSIDSNEGELSLE